MVGYGVWQLADSGSASRAACPVVRIGAREPATTTTLQDVYGRLHPIEPHDHMLWRLGATKDARTP